VSSSCRVDRWRCQLHRLNHAGTFHVAVKHGCSLSPYHEDMFAKYSVAEIANLFAVPLGVAMLMELLDGGSRLAGELARGAAVSPQAVSAHLATDAAGLVTLSQQGRHRYFRLASPEVGMALEALAATARPAPKKPVMKQADEVRRLGCVSAAPYPPLRSVQSTRDEKLENTGPFTQNA
jgi:DNA-binding transcriptional ArsR family regulator